MPIDGFCDFTVKSWLFKGLPTSDTMMPLVGSLKLCPASRDGLAVAPLQLLSASSHQVRKKTGQGI
eukprot:6363726-Amphidinium_carterae.1